MEKDNNYGNIPKGGRLVFGIFMVIVYVAVGMLFICDVLNIGNSVVSTIVGCLLCVYGVWRGYRLYKGFN